MMMVMSEELNKIPLVISTVHLSGTSTLNRTTWDSNKTEQLETAFRGLNGFEQLNITGLRLSNRTVDFEVDLSVKFEMSRLQGIVSTLEASLGAVFSINSVGMVTIESTEPSVPYMSESTLKCTFEEASSSSGWKITRMDECLPLYNGSVVKLDSSCATKEYKSCTSLTLHNLTSVWTGTYECEFSSGSIRHTATTELRVEPLPEDIVMTAKPVTVACSNRTANVTVDITATIYNDSNNYEVRWSYKGGNEMQSAADSLGYYFKVIISCKKTTEAHYVTVTFKNNKDQEKSARLKIPVIYEGDKFCEEDDLWPKTPGGDTVIKQTCPEGRVGYESRTCTGNKWQSVFSKCVSRHLFNLSRAAENFMTGQGATPEAAVAIFRGLRNSSMLHSNSSGRMADLTASIRILELMANASESNTLQNSVLPDFIHAASNMLDQTWDGGNNTSVIHDMSSNFLRSVEGLVKNIQINSEEGFITHNLALNLCPGGHCEVTMFNIMINMNKTSGLSKILGVKNLTDKLLNNFPDMVPSPILISASLENKEESFLQISLEFAKEQPNSGKPLCVFWNSTGRWSEEGCTAKRDTGNSTLCVCNHLTAFSALWFNSGKSPATLSKITTTPGPDSSKADHKETAKSILKVVFFMTPVFGLTWTTGLLLYTVDRNTLFFTIMDYSFCILNSFQGVFILLSGCFAEQKVREELLKLITVYSKRTHENIKQPPHA